jgi:hypothetical protein
VKKNFYRREKRNEIVIIRKERHLKLRWKGKGRKYGGKL